MRVHAKKSSFDSEESENVFLKVAASLQKGTNWCTERRVTVLIDIRLLFVPLQTCDTEMMSECCLVRLGGSDFHYFIANPSILFLSAAKIKRLQ